MNCKFILGFCVSFININANANEDINIENDSPNIIYVFPDQFRNHAMGFWGEEGFKQYINFRNDPVYTPNLNQFAKESLVLTSAQSNTPVSSPHRGILLTGMYPHKSGIPINCNSERPVSSLREDAVCISDVLADAGYDCAYFGKLHVDCPTENDPDNPGNYVESRRPAWDAYTPQEKRHGFNYWYSYGTFDHHKNPHYWDTNGKKHEPKEWSPLHEAKKVIEYLKNEKGERESKKPFFIMVGMNPPHAPYNSLDDCMEEDFNLYKDKSLDQLLIRDNADITMSKAKSTPYYFASITGVDRAFGLILNTLKELNLDKNTIVVFSSDHGETMCSHSLNDAKNTYYAEAMNVPFIIRYPTKIKPRVDTTLFSTPDVMPTLLDLVGLTKKIPESVQGNSYASVFLDEFEKEMNNSVLYLHNSPGEKDQNGMVNSYFPSERGLKTNKYTFAISINKQNEIQKVVLFDDKNDPYQLKNLYTGVEQKLFKELCKELGKKLTEIKDPWWEGKVLDEFINYSL